MRVLLLLAVSLGLLGCTHFVSGPHPLLILPDGFRGEVFLFGDKERGVVWKGQPLEIPQSGLLRVANLEALAAIRPDAYDARRASGRSIENRNRGGDGDVDGLWPIEVLGDDHQTTLIYFVVGTFHSKTYFENYRMKHDWMPILERFRSGKEPIQPPQPTTGSFAAHRG